MNLSQSLMKMIIKLLILMILFVLMFFISSFIYSARYWPDVYNYINANVTIKRIPTISELELTILKQDVQNSTEIYFTTDTDYPGDSTVDEFDIEEFMKDEFEFKAKSKRDIIFKQLKDYIELPPRPMFVDHIFLDEPTKQETSTEKNYDDEESEIKRLYDTPDYSFKTLVTGVVIENGFPNTPVEEVSEEPVVTRKYYTVQDKIKESASEIPSFYELGLNVNIEKLIARSTTKEGYLVGDNPDLMNEVDEVTEELVVTTTEANENELSDELEEDVSSIRILKDSVDVSKLSTRGWEDVEMFTKMPETLRMLNILKPPSWEVSIPDRLRDPACGGDLVCRDFAMSAFPWIVTIFVTNNTKNSQFSYYCDGALLSDKVIITDARCLYGNKKIWEPENVLVFLGKQNLQEFGGKEKVQKIKEILIHPNFTVDAGGRVRNDIALVIMEENVEVKGNIQNACIHKEDEGTEEAATTAWGLNGQLLPIFFNKEKGDLCFDKSQDIFCATYGNDVALCPSYGGIYATRQLGKWCLQGIFYGDPADRGICFTKDVYYTSLKNYLKWIVDNIELNRNDVL